MPIPERADREEIDKRHENQWNQKYDNTKIQVLFAEGGKYEVNEGWGGGRTGTRS